MPMPMPMPIVKSFRRFHSDTLLLSRQVVTDISKLGPESTVEQSGSSSATPFTSNRTIKKKVCIADRRAMLESFVNKYRATNLGKFPSPTSAQKEIGGSYYLIRKMIQEMEFNFKISSVEKGLVKGNKKQTKSEDTISREIAIEPSGSQEGSNSHISIGQQLCEDPWLESVGNFDTKLELKDGLQPSTSSTDTGNNNITRDDTHNIATESNNRGQFHEKLEQKPNDESPSEDNFALEESESNVEKQHDGIRNTMREIAIELSGSQEGSHSHTSIGQQLCENPCLESVGNSDSKLELKGGLQPSTSSANTGNSNITRDDTHNIATESHDRGGQFHEKLEQKLNDESPSKDNFALEKSESNIEKQHDGIRNTMRDMPEQQKEDEVKEKPSIWGNLKSLANGFFNISK